MIAGMVHDQRTAAEAADRAVPGTLGRRPDLGDGGQSAIGTWSSGRPASLHAAAPARQRHDAEAVRDGDDHGR